MPAMALCLQQQQQCEQCRQHPASRSCVLGVRPTAGSTSTADSPAQLLVSSGCWSSSGSHSCAKRCHRATNCARQQVQEVHVFIQQMQMLL
jgi:hypothetical protein